MNPSPFLVVESRNSGHRGAVEVVPERCTETYLVVGLVPLTFSVVFEAVTYCQNLVIQKTFRPVSLHRFQRVLLRVSSLLQASTGVFEKHREMVPVSSVLTFADGCPRTVVDGSRVDCVELFFVELQWFW